MTDSVEFGGFGDAEAVRGSFGGDSKLTFPFLVLEQVRRCAKAGSTEFRGGYRELRRVQPDIYVYVPATDEAFSESVLTLANMLAGYFDDNMQKAYASFHSNYSAARDKLAARAESEDKALPRAALNRRRVELARELFVQLCGLLKRINFFEGTGVEEGVVDDRT